MPLIECETLLRKYRHLRVANGLPRTLCRRVYLDTKPLAPPLLLCPECKIAARAYERSEARAEASPRSEGQTRTE
jgi:hypothetical protein